MHHRCQFTKKFSKAVKANNMQELQVIFSGVAQGCIYGLIALGFVLIYKATETVSFAQGELMMLGAFCGLGCVSGLGLPYWLAIPAAMLAMAALGWLTERVVIRPVLALKPLPRRVCA
jgi:branched-chain amino acid transport system permease protein